MKVGMKVGDSVICCEKHYENISLNKIYTISKLCSNDHLMIRCDKDRYGFYHKSGFISLKELRKLKLEKIGIVSDLKI